MRRALVLVAFALVGCTKSQIVDFTMASAPRNPPARRTFGPYQVLAGDLHCHVRPPDAPYHVSRELAETRALAREEGLDFVVLTPHVPARFFLDREQREWVRATQKKLRVQTDAEHDGPLLLAGMEYTDHRFGHVGLSFADVADVLDAVPLAALERNPQLFFETWHAKGGLTTINHPYLAPLPRAPVAELHYDLRWRDLTVDGASVLPEIRWLTHHATAIETWNETAGHVRDRWFKNDPAYELREATHLVDRLARADERRVAPVGGSDSHGMWIRPTTWVLALERAPSAIRDAIAAGRTCVRGPAACMLEVRGAGEAFHGVGASIASTNGAVEARVPGATTYFVNNAPVATADDGELTVIPVPGTCALLRAVVGDSVSAPVYVDCAWAGANDAQRSNMTGPPFSSAR